MSTNARVAKSLEWEMVYHFAEVLKDLGDDEFIEINNLISQKAAAKGYECNSRIYKSGLEFFNKTDMQVSLRDVCREANKVDLKQFIIANFNPETDDFIFKSAPIIPFISYFDAARTMVFGVSICDLPLVFRHLALSFIATQKKLLNKEI